MIIGFKYTDLIGWSRTSALSALVPPQPGQYKWKRVLTEHPLQGNNLRKSSNIGCFYKGARINCLIRAPVICEVE